MLRKMDENKANMTRTLASIAILEADLDRVRPELLIIFTYSINPFHATGRFLHPRFSDVFRRYRKRSVGKNGINN